MHKLLVLLCAFGYISVVQAQSVEIGPAFGVINYLGDLSAHSLEATQYNVALGAQGRYRFNRHWAVSLQANGGTVTGSDRYSGNRQRNLSVQTFIGEGVAQVEYRPVEFTLFDGHHVLAPYVAAGVGAFYFNPRGERNGSYVALQPLGTEGQGMPGYADYYRRVELNVPVGLGLEMRINEHSTIGFTANFRKTFTDYIDDVSGAYPVRSEMMDADRKLAYSFSYRTPEYRENAPVEMSGMRGNPDNMDNYVLALAHYTIRLGKSTGGSAFKLTPRRAQGKPTGKLFYTPSPYHGF